MATKTVKGENILLIGAQLFSVRNYLTDRKGIEEAFRRTRELGYRCVQYSGAPGGAFDPSFLSEMIAKYDLPVTLTHIPYQRLKEDLDGVIRDHLAVGCPHIGLGMMPREAMADRASLDAFVSEMRNLTERIEDAGCHFYYHNHNVEFMKIDGIRVFDYLLENLPDTNFTLDLHWVQRGGVSVLEYIEKCKGRIRCVHLKDFRVEWFDEKFAPVGEGNLNWGEILPALERNGTEYAFVEQDDAPDYGDPFEQMKISIDHLREWGYAK